MFFRLYWLAYLLALASTPLVEVMLAEFAIISILLWLASEQKGR